MPLVQAEHLGVLSVLQQQMESPWGLVGKGCCKALKHKPPLCPDFARASPTTAYLTQPAAEAKVSIETSGPGPALGIKMFPDHLPLMVVPLPQP